MSRDQIQTICDDAKVITDNDNKMIRCHINIKYFDWLVEQAERLHGTKHKMGYMDMYADCNRIVGSDSMKIHKLEQQNKRYREALEYIGNHANESELMDNTMYTELVKEIIEKALEGGK